MVDTEQNDTDNDEEAMDQTLTTAAVNPTGVSTKLIAGLDVQELDEPESPLLHPLTPPWRVALLVLEIDIQIVFDITDSVILGRSYPKVDLFAGIDLSPFNAFELGVSRHHAVLMLQDNHVIIRDNDSMNGTFLNKKKLKPNISYILRSGDQVNLARMALRFDLLYNPYDSQMGQGNQSK